MGRLGAPRVRGSRRACGGRFRAQRLPANRLRRQRDGDRQARRIGPGRLYRHRHRRSRRNSMPTGRRFASKARPPTRSATPISLFGTIQGTGGSSAMSNSWIQLREAGAKARAMLLAAAAKKWKVPVAELTVDKGVVYHAAGKRQASLARWWRARLPCPSLQNGEAEGSQGFQTDRPPHTARGRGGEVRRHARNSPSTSQCPACWWRC